MSTQMSHVVNIVLHVQVPNDMYLKIPAIQAESREVLLAALPWPFQYADDYKYHDITEEWLLKIVCKCGEIFGVISPEDMPTENTHCKKCGQFLIQYGVTSRTHEKVMVYFEGEK